MKYETLKFDIDQGLGIIKKRNASRNLSRITKKINTI